MRTIRKVRRESFGGIILSEHPGFTAFIDNRYADKLHIPYVENLPDHCLSAPLDVHMSLTTRCNLRCQGCYVLDACQSQQDMDLTLAKAIVDNLAKLNVFTIALGGGEPFLYPCLFELAHYIRSRQIVPNITTNGTLINEGIAPQCRVFGNVHLSLHHIDRLDILEQAVNHLRAEGILPGLNLLLTSETIKCLDVVFAWAARVGIDKILLLRFKLTQHNYGCNHMQILPAQEQKLFPRIRRLGRKFGIIPMIDCSLFPAVAIHKVREKELRFYDVNGCQGGDMYIAVDVNGQYKPCSFWPDTYGEVRHLSFDEWVNSPLLNKFRRFSADPICEHCDYVALCKTGCRLMDTAICRT